MTTRQQAVADVIAPVIDAHLDATFPAAAICVWRGGAILFEGAWGWLDPDVRTLPVTTETLFDLASVSKLFTTTAFLSLVSAGRVGLDDRLVEVVPEFGALSPRHIEGGQDPHSKARLLVAPALAGQSVDPAQVTFRHLLCHTSGLPPWRDAYNAAGSAPPAPDQPDPIGRAQRWSRGLAALVGYPFVAPPDGVVRYSDVGMMLLGEAVARLDGAPLDAVVQRRVIDPLGEDGRDRAMFNPIRDHGRSRAQIAPTEDDPTWRRRRAWGEVHDENCCGLGGVTGHAGVFGTARAVAALGHGWLHTPDRFGLTPAIVGQATSLQTASDGERRGLGFALNEPTDSMAGDRMSLRAYGHSGFTGTTLWIDPQADVIIAVLTNSVYYGRHSLQYAATHAFRRALHDGVMAAVAS
jgi:CubicO group peptidase (beta-lactamase class C family)